MGRKKSAGSNSGDLGAVALVGNYPPRECGIATFSQDLLTSLHRHTDFGDCYAIAMNDVASGYNYPPEVKFEVDHKRPQDYQLAARFLNMNRTGAVSLQHEYGIYGGESGCLILDLLEQLHMPVMSTLHTVLKKPDASQKFVLKRIAELSDSLVVMSKLSIEYLTEIYGVPEGRIAYIPHGIPDMPFVDPAFYKDQFQVEGKRVILTFGLLSPGKGIEYMIEAMPEIVRHYPDAVYIVLGKTHPNVLRESDEQYRGSLQQLVRQRGMQEHVIFHNEFVSLPRLIEFLGCADVYVTPYLNEAQAVSGTLAYALGAGKAVVSTPYWYAQEMLADGRGVIVPFRSTEALAGEITQLFSSTINTSAMRKRAYLYCRDMTWSNVAQQYAGMFSELTANRLRTYYSTWLPESTSGQPDGLPVLKLDHLRTLTDHTGVLQHARYSVPNKRLGYTTDDNARALMAAVMASRYDSRGAEARDLQTTYLSYLDYAFNSATGRFRNGLGFDGVWLDQNGTDDSHGRALWALGTFVNLGTDDGHIGLAMDLFVRALPASTEFTSPRAWAAALLGIHSFRGSFPGARTTRQIRDELAGRLVRQTEENSDSSWLWPEDWLTYDNARLPHALLVTGGDTGDDHMLQLGLKMLAWLLDLQTDGDELYAPIGNQGWYRRGAPKARYDQQPIEAEGAISACLEAYRLTGEAVWERRALLSMDWFLGRNDAKTPLYDYSTGGCHDGLQAQGVNQNEGAESTVAWLIALLEIMKHQSKLSLRKIDELDMLKSAVAG